MAKQYTFSKEERLSNVKQIDLLFNSGSSFSVRPLKIYFLVDNDTSGTPNKVLITISKKRFKRAVDRNRIRRKIKEAYRLNKKILQDEAHKMKLCVIIGIIYTGIDHNPQYSLLEKATVQCLDKLSNMITEK